MSESKLNVKTLIAAIVISVILSVSVSYIIIPRGTGELGPQGPIGETGPPGPKGEKGDIGPTYELGDNWVYLKHWKNENPPLKLSEVLYVEFTSDIWSITWIAGTDSSIDAKFGLTVYSGKLSKNEVEDAAPIIMTGEYFTVPSFNLDTMHGFGSGWHTILIDGVNLESVNLIMLQLEKD